MRSVVPGDLFSSDVMLPGFSLLSFAGSHLQLWLLRLKAYGVELIFIIVIAVLFAVVVIIVIFDFTRVRSRHREVGAFLHREQRVHAIWVEQ